MDSIFIIIIFITIFIIFESICFSLVKITNQKFQWLILKKDEKPILSKKGLEKFFQNGFDRELGWVRKPNTNNYESGKTELVKWSINEKGARINPGYEKKESLISCYGDSFTFGRQVNDNETWEHELSKLMNSNIQNFGVGNYGIDQSLLRLKREYNSNKTKYVILGIVPDSIRRNLNFWKHYFEYGNTFGFKPRFIISENSLKLIKNPIDSESKFYEYEKFLDEIRKYDYFYKNKFCKEIISFPYCITIFKNPLRNISIIYWVLKINLYNKLKKNTSLIEWKPMRIIMKINLKWRIRLYQDKEAKVIFKKIVEEFVKFSKDEKFQPIFLMLPQKDDILFIKSNYNFYNEFINELIKMEDLKVIDVTNELLKENDLDRIYSDNNEYGGHFSEYGNKKIANFVYRKFQRFF
ncbi:conserved hypothetical protein [metagenome]